MVVFTVLSGLLALLSVVVSVRAVAIFGKGQKNLASKGVSEPILAVLPVVTIGGADPGTVRAIAVIDEPSIKLNVAYMPGDRKTSMMVEKVRSSIRGAAVEAFEVPVQFRHVTLSALGLAAVTGPADTVLVLDPTARPSSRDNVVLADCARSSMAVPYPVTPGASDSGFGLVGRVLSSLTPVLAAIFGPIGPAPFMVAVKRNLVDSVAKNPLALNAPSLGAALADAVDPSSFYLVPRPVAVAGLGPFLLDHLTVLWKKAPKMVLVLIAYQLALPLAVTTAGVFQTTISWVILGMALAGRTMLSMTWTRSCRGMVPAILDTLLSPITLALSFLLTVVAISRKFVHVGRTNYRVHRGGSLGVN